MKSKEIYESATYKFIASEIEKHEDIIDALMDELERCFPSTDIHGWCIMATNRPKRYVKKEDDD